MGPVIGVSILLVVLVVALIIPVWAIIDCAVSYDKSGGAKAFWIIVILFTWSLGAMIYGFIYADSGKLRTLSTLGILVTIIAGAVIAYNPQYRAIFMNKIRAKYGSYSNY